MATETETRKYVRWYPAPGFTARVITKQDWEKIGCADDTVEWNAANQNRIPVENFSGRALRYVARDDGLEIVEE